MALRVVRAWVAHPLQVAARHRRRTSALRARRRHRAIAVAQQARALRARSAVAARRAVAADRPTAGSVPANVWHAPCCNNRYEIAEIP